MGVRLSAVSLKARGLLPGLVWDNTRLESFCCVLQNHGLTSRLVSKCRLSRIAGDVVHRRRCEAIVTQAAL
jgi:hypothetical protein